MVEMGRAVVHNDHRNGAVVLLMWAGILAYLDRCDYDYVTGCVSVPVQGDASEVNRRAPRSAAFATSCCGAIPRRPITGCIRIGQSSSTGGPLDEIAPPARPVIPPLMRGYLRLGARICGEPAHDADFGVGDFPALLDKRQADTRYLRRLRSMSAATEAASRVA